jgi:hypothetical protein
MLWDANDPNLLPTETWIGPDVTFGWAVTMACVVANDPSGPVQYYFDCLDGPYDSGWINVNTYTTGIVGRSGQLLRFRVQARDTWDNRTGWSTPETSYPPGPRP